MPFPPSGHKTNDPQAEAQGPVARPFAGRLGNSAVWGFLITLLLIEILARSPFFVDRQLPLALTALHHKAAWLCRQAPADVIIAGDSTANRGIDARQFAAEMGMRTLNTACTGGSPIVVRYMLSNLAKQPKVIVFGMFPVELSDDWAVAPHEVDVATVAERMQLIDKGQALLGSVWATYRRRTVITEWLLSWWRGPMPAVEPPDDDLGSRAFDKVSEIGIPEATQQWQTWVKADPPHQGTRWRVMNDLADHWQAAGIKVVYVVSPLCSSLRTVMAQQPRVDAFVTESVRQIATAHGFALFDCRAAVPDEAFHDVDHLRAGPWRDRFTKALAHAVRDGRMNWQPTPGDL